MFVSKFTYDKLVRELNTAILHLETYKREFNRVTKQWNALVERINAKGGEDFLEHGSMNGSEQFTLEEVERLIRLCHPDKHNQSVASNEATKKLLLLKEKMK